MLSLVTEVELGISRRGAQRHLLEIRNLGWRNHAPTWQYRRAPQAQAHALLTSRHKMIDFYTWITDNGYKPRVMLEETGLPYKLIPVNLREKAQMSPEFMKISPGHKIPAIVDHEGPGGTTVTMCESGAILKYLAEKSGKFYPTDAAARAKVDQWLFYGSATFTTLAQQFGHWTKRSPIKAPQAQEYYEANLRDMLGIFDRHLAGNEYFGGGYSIADMSMYSDVHLHGVNDIRLDDYRNVKRWHDAIEARPAVQRAWQPFAT
jgi:GST-like protein